MTREEEAQKIAVEYAEYADEIHGITTELEEYSRYQWAFIVKYRRKEIATIRVYSDTMRTKISANPWTFEGANLGLIGVPWEINNASPGDIVIYLISLKRVFDRMKG